tara:strand:- start:657 stop:1253 length:597 start_codon:yes stop_codon:yes gene_type:complete
MQKKAQVYIILFIIILAIAAFFFFRTTSPDEDAERADISGQAIKQIEDNLGFQGVMDPITVSKSHISFEGFGPGKSHEGKFTNWNGELHIENNQIVGFDGTIQSDSLDAKIFTLTKHLKSDDFLNTEKFPTIKFKSNNLESNTLSGDLTFLGITNQISFPVTITEDSLSADFILDTSQFGTINEKANAEVRIFFELFK